MLCAFNFWKGLKLSYSVKYNHISSEFILPRPIRSFTNLSYDPETCFVRALYWPVLRCTLSRFIYLTYSGDALELCLNCNSNYSSSTDTRILCHCTQIIYRSNINSSPTSTLPSIGNMYPSVTQQPQIVLLTQTQAEDQTQAQEQAQTGTGSHIPSVGLKHTLDEMQMNSNTCIYLSSGLALSFSQSDIFASLGLPYRATRQPFSITSTMMFSSLGICSSILLSEVVYLDDREFSNTSLTRSTPLSVIIAGCLVSMSIFFPPWLSFICICHHSFLSLSSFLLRVTTHPFLCIRTFLKDLSISLS